MRRREFIAGLGAAGWPLLVRREFIAGLGGAVAWPLKARAQQRTQPIIGFLSLGTSGMGEAVQLIPFRQVLKDSGYIEGQT
jgi:putative tryptophan/tyrosine transport system substrate-binding protein